MEILKVIYYILLVSITFATTGRSEITTAICHFKRRICGDKCTDYGQTCQCNHETFNKYDGDFYCCSDTPCEKNYKGDVTCSSGKKLKFHQKCAKSCPIQSPPWISISSSCPEQERCPDGDLFSKICLGESYTVENLNSIMTPQGSNDKKKCEPSFHSPDHVLEQSYWTGTRTYNSDYMTCFSRGDKNKEMFSRKPKRGIKSKLRRNFDALVSFEDGMVHCKNGNNYHKSDLCNGKGGEQRCTLQTGEEVILCAGCTVDYENLVDFCQDYSFWKGPERCVSVNKNEVKTRTEFPRTHASMCKNNDIDCKSTLLADSPVHASCPSSSTKENCIKKTDHFFCTQSKTCINKKKLCDGVVHCLFAEDEHFDICKKENVFPDGATIECVENRPGYDITILAVPCNGVSECRDGSDEDCGGDIMGHNITFVFWVTLLFLYVSSLVIIFGIHYHVNGTLIPPHRDVTAIVASYGPYVKFYTGNMLAFLKNNTSQLLFKDILKTEDVFDKIFSFVVNENTILMVYPTLIVLSQIDLIKDILLTITLFVFNGGLAAVISHPLLFSSSVIILFLLTIITPQALGVLRWQCSLELEGQSWKERLCWIGATLLSVILAPFFILYQKFYFIYLEMKMNADPNDRAVIKKWEETKRLLNSHIRLELGLETTYQLAGQLILLGLAFTETATDEGFRTVFEESKSYMTITFLVISNLWSFISCTLSYLTGLSGCRERFPISSKAMAASYSFTASVTRVLPLVMFFAVPLGLFSLLRHLQGEQVPWHPILIYNFVGSNATGMVFFGNESFDWSLIDQWTKNQSVSPFTSSSHYSDAVWNPDYLVSPPDYTSYTYFRLRSYFLIFLAILAFHILIIFLIKMNISTIFSKEFNCLEKLIHCLENSNIPHNVQEWDTGKGNAEVHKLRMKANLKETISMILVKAVFNLILILPICYLVSKMQERHDILWKTIGYRQEEQDAMVRGILIRNLSLGAILIGCVVEIVFFSLYNGPFHPLANILKDDTNQDTELAVMENTPASQFEIEEEANAPTSTLPQNVPNQDTELAVMENTPASQVEIEEEPNESTATPSQDAHNQDSGPTVHKNTPV